MTLRIEKQAAALPSLRNRLWEIETLISATELLLKENNPDWTSKDIQPVRPHVHHIPIKLGWGVRKALEVLRDASEPMTLREIVEEVLRREDLQDTDTANRDRIYKTVDAGLRKRREQGFLVSDSNWPAR